MKRLDSDAIVIVTVILSILAVGCFALYFSYSAARDMQVAACVEKCADDSCVNACAAAFGTEVTP